MAALDNFEYVGTCDAGNLSVMEEVRDMCAADRCQNYNKNWACPPACGTLDDYRQLISSYDRCLVVQTVSELEDAFDFEEMEAAMLRHTERMNQLAEELWADDPDTLILGSGPCLRCETCTYPDAPCRFPQKRLVSMEAAGLLVSDVCLEAGLEYNHGPLTITYTGCALSR